MEPSPQYDEEVRHAVRRALRDALESFARAPLLSVREASQQHLIWSRLEAELGHATVPLRPVEVGTRGLHDFAERAVTNRVSGELKVDGKRVDLVVFRKEGPVHLEIGEAGPGDALATVRGAELAAVIEVKAAPSRLEGIRREVTRDLSSLASIARRHPGCLAFFVLFDKSLPLAGASSRTPPSFAWLDGLAVAPRGPVEAHFLDANGQWASRIGDVQPKAPVLGKVASHAPAADVDRLVRDLFALANQVDPAAVPIPRKRYIGVGKSGGPATNYFALLPRQRGPVRFRLRLPEGDAVRERLEAAGFSNVAFLSDERQYEMDVPASGFEAHAERITALIREAADWHAAGRRPH